MRYRYWLPFALAALAGCAGNCQTCRGAAWQGPSAQSDDAAPRPPRAPAYEEEEPLPELPAVTLPKGPEDDGEEDPAPRPTPRPRTKARTGGRVRHVSTRDVEGRAIVIDGNTGYVAIGSTGVPAAMVQAQAPAPAMQQALAPMAYPLIPGPVPDAVVFRFGQRIAKAAYVLATGECPPPKAVAPVSMMMAVPVQTMAYVPVQMAAPAVQYVQQAPQAVQVMPAPAPQMAAAPQPMASPQQQAPRKHWFGIGR